jgi:hypothetical protein
MAIPVVLKRHFTTFINEGVRYVCVNPVVITFLGVSYHAVYWRELTNHAQKEYTTSWYMDDMPKLWAMRRDKDRYHITLRDMKIIPDTAFSTKLEFMWTYKISDYFSERVLRFPVICFDELKSKILEQEAVWTGDLSLFWGKKQIKKRVTPMSPYPTLALVHKIAPKARQGDELSLCARFVFPFNQSYTFQCMLPGVFLLEGSIRTQTRKEIGRMKIPDAEYTAFKKTLRGAYPDITPGELDYRLRLAVDVWQEERQNIYRVNEYKRLYNDAIV